MAGMMKSVQYAVTEEGCDEGEEGERDEVDGGCDVKRRRTGARVIA